MADYRRQIAEIKARHSGGWWTPWLVRLRLLGVRLLRVVARVGVRAAAIAVIVGIGWLVLRLFQ